MERHRTWYHTYTFAGWWTKVIVTILITPLNLLIFLAGISDWLFEWGERQLTK